MSTCYGSRFSCSANRFELLQPMLRDRAVDICASKLISRIPGLLTVLAMAPVIVTSQGWIKLFDGPVIAEAIVVRLIHPCQKITLKGETSFREKLAEKKSRLKNQGG